MSSEALPRSIVLPAPIWKAYARSCARAGGIGGGAASDAVGLPLCLLGHAVFLAAQPGDYEGPNRRLLEALAAPFRPAGLTPLYSAFEGLTKPHDNAIAALVGYRAMAAGKRVTWERYCARRGVTCAQ